MHRKKIALLQTLGAGGLRGRRYYYVLGGRDFRITIATCLKQCSLGFSVEEDFQLQMRALVSFHTKQL